MFCSNCGKEIDDNAVICPGCGCAVNKEAANKVLKSGEKKNWVVAYLLAWFLGGFGAHRFYTGHIGTAIAMLLTLGGCGIWAVVDFITLSFNKFKDNDGNELEGYLQVLGMIGFGLLIFGVLFYIVMLFLGVGVAALSET